MKIKEIFQKNDINIFDDNKGLGAVPDNLNVDYKGLRVLMLPSVFLELSKKTDQYKSVHLIKNHILQGGKIGHPFLILEIPTEWRKNNFRKAAKVVSHEGRNRVKAIIEIFGDIQIEVHIFALKYRNHDFDNRWLESIKNKLISENNHVVKNPVIEFLN